MTHAPTATGAPRGRARLLLAVAIVLAGALAYLPSLPGEFIWDDDAHVTHNAVLRSLGGLRDIWIPRFEPRYEPNTPQYYPLAFTALWLQFQAFGVEPLGYHLVNLAFHLANALLVWALFERLRVRGAWLVGALFALHPVHVETTAWAMEIKNLLSALFYLLAALCYLRFDERWSGERKATTRRFPSGPYALALGLFLCALLAKSITCTLPAALVLALLWRRERLSVRRLAPLAPFLALGIALALNTAWLEHNHVGAEGAQFDFSLAERALIASRVLLFYPSKLLFPWPLLFVYPRWNIAPGVLNAWWPLAAVLLIAAGALFAYAKGRRGPALALAYFAGSIFPALGIVTYYPMLFTFVADHFNYLPSLGILALIAAAIEQGLRDARLRAAASIALLVTLGGLTALQSSHFATAEALYRHTLAYNPDAWLARTQLAQLLLPGGQPWKTEQRALDPADLREAEELLRGAIALKEDHAMPHYNLALSLYHQGRNAEALPHASRAAELAPLDPELAAIAGVIAFLTGDVDAAESRARRALELDGANFKAGMLLGDCLIRRQRFSEARDSFVRALAVAPNAEAGALCAQKIRFTLQRSTPAEALAVLDELVARGIALPFELAQLRAGALASLGRYAEAIQLTERLLAQAGGSGATEAVNALRQQLELWRRAAAE